MGSFSWASQGYQNGCTKRNSASPASVGDLCGGRGPAVLNSHLRRGKFPASRFPEAKAVGHATPKQRAFVEYTFAGVGMPLIGFSYRKASPMPMTVVQAPSVFYCRFSCEIGEQCMTGMTLSA